MGEFVHTLPKGRLMVKRMLDPSFTNDLAATLHHNNIKTIIYNAKTELSTSQFRDLPNYLSDNEDECSITKFGQKGYDIFSRVRKAATRFPGTRQKKCMTSIKALMNDFEGALEQYQKTKKDYSILFGKEYPMSKKPRPLGANIWNRASSKSLNDESKVALGKGGVLGRVYHERSNSIETKTAASTQDSEKDKMEAIKKESDWRMEKINARKAMMKMKRMNA